MAPSVRKLRLSHLAAPLILAIRLTDSEREFTSSLLSDRLEQAATSEPHGTSAQSTAASQAI